MTKVNVQNLVSIREGGVGQRLRSASSPAQHQRSFSAYLKEKVSQVNDGMVAADKKATGLAIGQHEDIAGTMVGLAKSELSFQLMVQVRNRALEAYQEVMRMPV